MKRLINSWIARAVLSIALGVAYLSAQLFGVSLALGAFLAGMILS